MTKKYPWEWDEEEIWASVFDDEFATDSRPGEDLLEYWKDRFGIDGGEYNAMQTAAVLVDEDKTSSDPQYMSFLADHTLEYLEFMLRRPTMSSQQRKLAKLLRDRLKKTIESYCMIRTFIIQSVKG